MTGALVSALLTGAIGLMASLLPQVWIQLFSTEAAVVDVGSAYLVRVAPFYALFGMGLSLYFASRRQEKWHGRSGRGSCAWASYSWPERIG